MSSKLILVVDDSAVARGVARHMLTKAGLDVHCAASVADAVSFLVDGGRPDLILTDFNMPDADGVALIDRLRHSRTMRETPILVMTAGADACEKERAKSAGATGWILKPFDTEKLVSAIERLTH